MTNARVPLVFVVLPLRFAVLAQEKKKDVVSGDPARLERIRTATMPKIDKPVSFETPEADAICSALEVFPPDNPWNLLVEDWPLHPNSKNIIASIGPDKPLRYNPDMTFILVPPDQKKSQRQDRRLSRASRIKGRFRSPTTSRSRAGRPISSEPKNSRP